MATMQQVADRAGVSIATVSFVVNGTKYVTPATTARVEAAMRELKFRGNLVARALASRRTRIIALLFPTVGNRFSPTTSEFFMSAAERASQRGYHLVLWPVDPAGEDLDDLVSGGLVDGVVLMEVRMDDPRVRKLSELDVPFTLIGRTRDSSDLPFVDIDFETTIEDSLDHLQELGTAGSDSCSRTSRARRWPGTPRTCASRTPSDGPSRPAARSGPWSTPEPAARADARRPAHCSTPTRRSRACSS